MLNPLTASVVEDEIGAVRFPIRLFETVNGETVPVIETPITEPPALLTVRS
jgi:hypothetical protein